jgi:hypothetical protein
MGMCDQTTNHSIITHCLATWLFPKICLAGTAGFRVSRFATAKKAAVAALLNVFILLSYND